MKTCSCGCDHSDHRHDQCDHDHHDHHDNCNCHEHHDHHDRHDHHDCHDHHHDHHNTGCADFEAEANDMVPSIFSFEETWNVKGISLEELELLYASQLLEIENWCLDHSALIGHIKLSLTAKSGTIVLSCTGNGIQKLGQQTRLNEIPDKIDISLVAIVYGIEAGHLAACIEEIFIKQ